MWHVQHLSLESLVKMDHFQKEPPLNLKGPLGHKGVARGQYLKEQIGNPGHAHGRDHGQPLLRTRRRL